MPGRKTRIRISQETIQSHYKCNLRNAFPRVFRFKQKLDGPVLEDVAGAIRSQFRDLGLHSVVKPGQTIAITAGSRGIANIEVVIRTVVDECKALGLKPFITPTMGSHGGATADGQRRLLEHYGITEHAMGCPIKSSMEVVRISKVDGKDVFCDKNAWNADHIGVVARIKAHTDFDHEIESGLFKMMAIGLGKKEGAEQYHRAGKHYGYGDVFFAVGKTVLVKTNVLFGLAIVENGYNQTAKIRALLPNSFYESEKSLLQEAKKWAARLPFDVLDLLIIDEIGKNISGIGMDPEVIGRPTLQKFPKKPEIQQIFVRNLTPETEGNAIGIGMADITTKRLVKSINHTSMNINAITSSDPNSAKIPMAFACDVEAIGVALCMAGPASTRNARIARIKNTLKLDKICASEALLRELEGNGKFDIISGPSPMTFDKRGNLPSF